MRTVYSICGEMRMCVERDGVCECLCSCARRWSVSALIHSLASSSPTLPIHDDEYVLVTATATHSSVP